MKKSFLLLAAGVIAASAHGQTAQKSIVFNHGNDQMVNNSKGLSLGNAVTASSGKSLNKVERTTGLCTACGRWYDYADSVLGINGSLVDGIGFTDLDIWKDTTAIFGYTDGTYSNAAPYPFGSDFTSVGLLFHPWAEEWNASSTFAGTEPAITPTNNYTIDSINIAGNYGRNNAKPGIVDTLIVQFVSGDGSSTSNLPGGIQYSGTGAADLLADYGLASSASIPFLSMLFDTANNRAGGSGGALGGTYPFYAIPVPLTTGTYKFLLTTADTMTVGTVGVGGSLNITYPRPGHVPADPIISYAVTAGNFSAASVSFKSGDPATYTATFPDTVRYATTGAYKYGSYGPILAYAASTSATNPTAYPPYVNTPAGTDWTSGYFNLEGARSGGHDYSYTPNWGWTGTGGASSLQYPAISYHVECPTCVTVSTPSLGVNNVTAENTVNAYPNPAANELTISYTLANSTSVTVSLTNMLGQTVATQKIANTTTGSAIFNTTAIADGIYIYTLEANGNRTTGRVSIAH